VLTTKEQTLETIIAQARNGSREAFDELIRRFEKKVMKTALFLTRNLADAQDVAQEVYIKIFRYLDAFEEAAKIEHWVYRITVNAARDFQRRRRFWLPLKDSLLTAAPPDTIGRHEFRSRLMGALRRLSFNERAVFVLRIVEEMEHETIAKILGCSPVTVRGHLHSARKKLQKDFPERQWTNF
jgi:RNA polymerase sigma-70 factor, ECF subfamily